MQKKDIELVDVEYKVQEQKKSTTYVPGMAKDMLIGGRDSGNVFIFPLMMICVNPLQPKSLKNSDAS